MGEPCPGPQPRNLAFGPASQPGNPMSPHDRDMLLNVAHPRRWRPSFSVTEESLSRRCQPPATISEGYPPLDLGSTPQIWGRESSPKPLDTERRRGDIPIGRRRGHRGALRGRTGCSVSLAHCTLFRVLDEVWSVLCECVFAWEWGVKKLPDFIGSQTLEKIKHQKI